MRAPRRSAFLPREAPGDPHVVLAEAGTGTGKTLAYVAPASLWAERNGGSGLGQHLHAAPAAADRGGAGPAVPGPAERRRRVVIRKGRENYLCLLNLEEQVNLASGQRRGDRRAGAGGALGVGDGGRGRAGRRPAGMVRRSCSARRCCRRIADRRGECIHGACPHYRTCFVEHTIRRARGAELVVANHALVMAQAAWGGIDDDGGAEPLRVRRGAPRLRRRGRRIQRELLRPGGGGAAALAAGGGGRAVPRAGAAAAAGGPGGGRAGAGGAAGRRAASGAGAAVPGLGAAPGRWGGGCDAVRGVPAAGAAAGAGADGGGWGHGGARQRGVRAVSGRAGAAGGCGAAAPGAGPHRGAVADAAGPAGGEAGGGVGGVGHGGAQPDRGGAPVGEAPGAWTGCRRGERCWMRCQRAPPEPGERPQHVHFLHLDRREAGRPGRGAAPSLAGPDGAVRGHAWRRRRMAC